MENKRVNNVVIVIYCLSVNPAIVISDDDSDTP